MSDSGGRAWSPPPGGSGPEERNRQWRWRFVFFATLLGASALFVLSRYALLMFNPPPPSRVNPPKLILDRGAILDRNGRTLALQTRFGDVKVWKPNIQDIAALCQELSPFLEMTPLEIEERIAAGASNNVILKRRVDEDTVRGIEAAIKERRLPGVGIDPVVGRIYPEKRIASQLIGFVGTGQNGLEGIEYAFDGDLAPKEENGHQVILTIDANIQYILEDIARRVLRESRAEAVMLLGMDPRNGEILGSAVMPDFDPNDFSAAGRESWMNRPVVWAYEPGSVFKIYSLASFLDTAAIGARSTFLCNGRWERVTSRGERVVINCLASHGTVSPQEIIALSCNAGAAYASDRMGAADFYGRLRDFGFGSRTGAGSPGENAGYLAVPETWSERSKATVAIGQEISVSALQMLQAATAIANDGVLVSPRFVSRIVSWNGSGSRNFESPPPRRVLHAETARAIRSYMVEVTSITGTGWRANVEDLSIAVKTGTAQVAGPGGAGYSGTDHISSCLALVPADQPALVLYLVIIKPQGEYLAGRIAAPPVREAAEALVDYLGIPRGRNQMVEHPGSVVLPPIDIPRLEDRVPDFTGYSKKQILPLILRDDVRIEMQGSGWVRRQDPPAGTPFAPGMTIRLDME